MTDEHPAIDTAVAPTGELWVLLWSHRANAFHVEPLQHMLKSNVRAYADDRPMDYVPILIGTYDQCSTTAAGCRYTLARRQEGRAAARDAIDQARRKAAE
jgi:hypothetical protein